MNEIINILSLEDDSVNILNVAIEGTTREFTIEKNLVPTYCPSCGCRMYSRSIKTRTVKHPVFKMAITQFLR